MIDIDERCLQHVVDILKGKKKVTDEVRNEIVLQLQRRIDGQVDYNKRKALKMVKAKKPLKRNS